MTLLRPGDHGSTFGGNPLASAVGEAALDVLIDQDLTARAADLGAYLAAGLRQLPTRQIREIRGVGLLLGIEIRAAAGTARNFCEQLLARGVLCKDTHAQVIRLAPPLTIERTQLDWLLEQLRAVFD
jgi:ornithine--oxo-acid transaminase